MNSLRARNTKDPIYLITGGAGFIGSHLAETLAISGQRVRVLDDFSNGKQENLASVADRVELIEGSITNPEVCRRACDGVDFVLHHAAQVSVAESCEEPVLYEQVNALGTLNMLCAARDAGCRRFIYAGSASAYGESTVLPHREDLCPQPLSPYAVAKHAGELYCQTFHHIFGFETVVLRYFNIFGPRQDASSPYSGVIARFIQGLLDGDQITVFGDGRQSRDFVAIENVVEANLLACTVAEAAGQLFNIGCGERTTITELASVLKDLTGSSASIQYGPSRQGDIRHSVSDIRRAETVMGYKVSVPVVDGLRRTIAWYRDVNSTDREPD